MKKLLLSFSLLTCLFSFGQVTVTGVATATYSTLNAAFAAINAGTHTGTITIDITGSTNEPSTPTPLIANGQGAASYTSIVIRPTVVATIAGTMVTGRGVIEIDGADNVTIDGDIVGGPVNRDLTIQNNAASTILNTAAVRLIGRTTLGLGVDNFSLLNCRIVGSTPGNDGISGSTVTNSYAFYAGGNGINLNQSGSGSDYDNMMIDNNEFTRAYYGLYIGALTGSEANNNVISNNVFSSTTPSQQLAYRGIEVRGLATSTISQNEVMDMRVSSTISNAGISTESTISNNILFSRNRVHGIWSTNTAGRGAYGINLAGGSNHTVINNLIYDIMTTNYNSLSNTLQAYGIRITNGTGIKIIHNTVHLFGNVSGGSTTNCYSSALVVTSTVITGLEIYNNIFSNTQSSTVTTPRFYAMFFPTSYNFINATLNNNAYQVTGSSTHFIGRIGTSVGIGEYSNLSAWQAMSQVNNPTNDNASVPFFNGPAPFISNTNLDFPVSAVTPIESGASTTTVTTIDYTGSTRPKAGTNPNTNPDIGAYEFDGLSGVPNDVGISALLSPATTGCYSAAENLIVSIKNYGTSAQSNIPVTIIVSGAATQTSTGTYTGSIAAGASANFTVGTLNMSAGGVYSLSASTNLVGDGVTANDALPVTTRTVIASSPLPQMVSFTGFTGANLPTAFPLWSEATGSVVPTGTTSIWNWQTGLGGAGNITARINLITTTRNEWIVGPKFLATASSQITFDAAVTMANSITTGSVMGSDDMLRVMVSTDCGVSFAPIYTISATNSLSISFTNFVVPLGAYAGQDIIVAFLAQDGPFNDAMSYDLHLDNINLYNASAQDAGVTGLIQPAPNGCYSAAENVVVSINNFGTAPITNVPVTVRVAGVTSQTVNGTYTGTIAPATSANFTVGVVNMTTVGTYNFKAYTSLTGDGNLPNDTLAVLTRTVVGVATLPQNVPFTGFTGANLSTVFPLWSEATGSVVPTGSTSVWTFQNGIGGVGNTTARINLISTNRNEWIIGPKFSATSASQISFDAAVSAVSSTVNPMIMGSDDKVRVMVSTDCGLSYTPIYTVSATNSLTINFTNFIVPLGSYAGQDIIVAFLAQDGPINDAMSYDFHLDNINLYNAAAADAGVASIISPVVNGCYSANEDVVVTIKNYGSASISNVPVNITMSGPISQTISNTYTPSIGVGASATFTVGTVDMSVGGIYTFTAGTSLAGDPNAFNDVSTATRTMNPIFSITGNTVICVSGSTTLSAVGAGSSYTWSTGGNTQSIAVTPTATTVYSVSVSNGTCTSMNSTTVIISNPTITANSATTCAGYTASLTATATDPVYWFSSPTATNVLSVGNTYTTVAVSTTTYYAESSYSLPSSLTTTMVGGNGQLGTMFDITAVNPIQINGFDMNINGTTATTVEVWYRPGSYLGFETTTTGWTNVLTTTVIAAGNGSMTIVPGSFSVNVPAGQTYGFYVTTNGGPNVSYTNGTVLGNLFVSNSDLQFFEGKGGAYFNVTFSPRIFNGRINYSKPGCTSPRIPVTLTVSPSPTVNVTTTNTLICTGSSATLIANGATTYSWSTGQTTQGIIVTPTASVNYSVTGTQFGCSSTATITQWVSTCAGVEGNSIENSGIIIYPNPNSGNINVIVENLNETAILEIFDAIGRKIDSHVIKEKSTQISTANLAKGVYIYRLKDEDGKVKQGKLIRE